MNTKIIYIENEYILVSTDANCNEKQPFILTEMEQDSGIFLVMKDSISEDHPFPVIYDTLQAIRPFNSYCKPPVTRFNYHPKAGYWELDETHLMLLEMIVPDLIK